MPNAPLQNFEAREAYAHHAPQSEQKAIAAAAPRRAAPTAASAPDHPVAQAPSAGADKNMAAPASDPTYYTARSLDVYPRALTALHLGLRAGAGQVRATLLIDESGTVNDVRAIEAGAADIENAARDLLLRTRFTPAGKDGRLVKSQLLVSLDYDAR
jgi:protein TonB